MIRMKFWAFWYIVCLCLENAAAKVGKIWGTQTGAISRKTRQELARIETLETGQVATKEVGAT